MPTENSQASNHSSFSNSFFNALLGAMTSACVSPWQRVDVPDVDAPRDVLDPVRLNLTLQGELEGGLVLEFTRSEALILTSMALKEPASEFEEKQMDSLVKIVTSAGQVFCGDMADEHGNFAIDVSPASETELNRANVFQLSAADGEGNRASIWIYVDPGLAEELARRSAAAKAVEDSDSTMNPDSTLNRAINLDLVMDVELNVTLRFGQRRLTLREVLELTSGSVVELDRQVEEPVELLLDGMVIAKGEAVVIDGNYGLRVTELLRPISSAIIR